MEEKVILIVDDDITALDLIDYLFEDRGFTVERSADGASAIEAVDQFNPHAILIDLMMPKVSGQDAVREIRAKGYQGPIVAFTALSDPEVHADAIDSGCNLVLTKPSKPKQLVEQVTALIQEAG